MPNLPDSKWAFHRSSPKALAFLLACAVMYFRQPAFFSAPRFWAEEGAVYFQYALYHPWYKVLFLPNPRFDYYSIFNNLAALAAARLVSLEQAPLVTTLLAFVVQTIPLAIIIGGDSELYNSHLRRLLAVLIILFTLSSREIWLNTINSPFYMLLTTALILFEQFDGAGYLRIWSLRFLVLLAGLSGPISCVLAPLFFIKALFEKKREYVIQTLILLITSCLQFVVFLRTLNQVPLTAGRFSELNFATFGYIVWSRTILLPITGVKIAERFAEKALFLHDTNSNQFWLLGSFLLMGLIATLLISRFGTWRYLQYDRSLLMIGAYSIIVTLSIVTSITHGNKLVLINPGWSPRYFYVPSVLLLLLILVHTQAATKSWFVTLKSSICWVLLSLSLYNGIVSYKTDLNWSADWPNWQMEVTKYQTDRTYTKLQIWPPNWHIELDKP